MGRTALLEHGSRSLIAFPRIGWRSPVTETFLIDPTKLVESDPPCSLATANGIAILPPFRPPPHAGNGSGIGASGRQTL